MVALRAPGAGDRPAFSLADLEAFDPGTAPGRTERRFCCPFPPCADKRQDAAHRSLSLNTATGVYLCHRCETAGKLTDHWEHRPRLRGRAAARAAFGLAGAGAPPKVSRHDPVVEPVPEPVAVALNDTPGAAYLAARGIPTAIADAAGVCFSRDWFGRPAVLFPIGDQAGDVIAWDGRYIDGGTSPKGRTSGPKSAGVFLGTPDALSVNPLVIAEGAIDALSLAVAGVPAVALCGVAWPAWLPRAAAFRDVLLGLDADAAGNAATKGLAKALTFGSRPMRLAPRDAKDWNEIIRARGGAWLGRHVFDRAAGFRYRAVHRRLGVIFEGQPPAPHEALAVAIDAGDWHAFDRELRVYESLALPEPLRISSSASATTSV